MVVRKKNTTSKKTAMDVVKKSVAHVSSRGIGTNVIYGISDLIQLCNLPPNKLTTGLFQQTMASFVS